ncbi:MAG: hypothetical protein WCJ19_05590 [bacterium]
MLEPEKSFLPDGIKSNLNWFAANPDTTKIIVNVLYIIAVIFAIIAIYNILAAAWDQGSDRDM